MSIEGMLGILRRDHEVRAVFGAVQTANWRLLKFRLPGIASESPEPGPDRSGRHVYPRLPER